MGAGVSSEGGPLRGAAVARWSTALWSRALWVVVGLGGCLRLIHYLDNRSLWLDESLLALNLISESPADLLRSLDYGQSAPPGFLLVEKAFIDVFGEAELALRLFPFLASLASLVLFALVARRILKPNFALIAVALFAVSESLIYQAAETKPYSSDVTLALLVVWWSLRVLDHPDALLKARGVLPLAAVGVGALALSFPSVFVVASAAGALLIEALARRASMRLLIPLSLGALWAGIFLFVYLTSSDTIASVSSQIFGGSSSSGAEDVARAFWYTIADPGGFRGVPHALAALLLLPGAVSLARRCGMARFVLLVGPVALALVAAVLNKYPLGSRFSLFLVPFLLILVVQGLDQVTALVRRSRWRRLLVAAFVVVLMAAPVRDALVQVRNPPRGEHVRPLVQSMVQRWEPGDGAYIFRNAQYAFRYYGECGECGVSDYPFKLKLPVERVENDGLPAALTTNPPVGGDRSPGGRPPFDVEPRVARVAEESLGAPFARRRQP